MPFAIFFAFAFVECIGVASKWWLTYWGANGNQSNQVYFLTIYGAINIFNVIVVFFRLVFIMLIGLQASRKVGFHCSNTVIAHFEQATHNSYLSSTDLHEFASKHHAYSDVVLRHYTCWPDCQSIQPRYVHY